MSINRSKFLKGAILLPAIYTRLANNKKKYDSDGLFFVHHGAGSESWSDDGFTRIK